VTGESGESSGTCDRGCQRRDQSVRLGRTGRGEWGNWAWAGRRLIITCQDVRMACLAAKQGVILKCALDVPRHVGLEECGLGNGKVGRWGLRKVEAIWIGRRPRWSQVSCGATGTGAGPCRTPPFCRSNRADEAPLPRPARPSAAWTLLSDQFGIAQQPAAPHPHAVATQLTSPTPRSVCLRTPKPFSSAHHPC
jgi:hypothetical protein